MMGLRVLFYHKIYQSVSIVITLIAEMGLLHTFDEYVFRKGIEFAPSLDQHRAQFAHLSYDTII